MNLFYLHIPKAGGTTLNHILDRNYIYSNQFTYSTINKKRSYEKISQMSLKQKKQKKIVRGHFVYGFHSLFDIDDPIYFTIMRNPVDRILSHYYYSLRKKNHYLYKLRNEKKITLEEYVLKISPEAQNGMSKQIAGVYVNDNFGYTTKIEKCDNEDILYEKAIYNIENHFKFVGLTEEFNKSILLMKKILGGSKISYYYYNKNENRNAIYQPTKDEKDIIFKYNKADVKLYDYCKKKFEKDFYTFCGNTNTKFMIHNKLFKQLLNLHRLIYRIL